MLIILGLTFSERIRAPFKLSSHIKESSLRRIKTCPLTCTLTFRFLLFFDFSSHVYAVVKVFCIYTSHSNVFREAADYTRFMLLSKLKSNLLLKFKLTNFSKLNDLVTPWNQYILTFSFFPLLLYFCIEKLFYKLFIQF